MALFPHTVLANSSNDATNFQRTTDCLAALGFIDHDLPLESGDGTRRSPSNGVRKISESFPITLVLLVGSYLLTNAHQASNPSHSLLFKTIFSAFPLQKRKSVCDRSLLQHSSTQHLPSHRVADPTQSQWLHLQVVPPLL